MSERTRSVPQAPDAGQWIDRAATEARRRGHPSRTAYAGAGGLLGGVLGSFFGRAGAGIGGLLGALLGAVLGARRDRAPRALAAGDPRVHPSARADAVVRER